MGTVSVKKEEKVLKMRVAMAASYVLEISLQQMFMRNSETVLLNLTILEFWVLYI